MDRVEKIKKILSEFKEAIITENEDFHYNDLLEATDRICQLEPRFTQEHHNHIKEYGFNPKICKECEEIDVVLMKLLEEERMGAKK